MLAELTYEELSAGLDAVVVEVLQTAGVAAPPVDAFALASALGVCVARDDRQEGRARYVRLRPPHQCPQPAILVKADPRAERRHWAVAHEIGEHLAHRLFERLDIDPRVAPSQAREMTANQFASRLLLPKQWFLAAGTAARWDLLVLKQHFATASHELIARRMLDFSPPIAISIFDEGRLGFRGSNQPVWARALQAVERRCWLQAHATGRVCEEDDGVFCCVCYPIHEPTFRREILRTELPGEGL